MKHWARTVLEGIASAHERLPSELQDGVSEIANAMESSDVYRFRKNELTRLAEQLEVCSDLEGLSQLMWMISLETGFRHFSIFVINQGKSGLFKTRYLTSMSEEWVSTYLNEKLFHCDPIIHSAAVAKESFCFHRQKSRDPISAKFWEHAQKFKLGNGGICFLQDMNDGARIGISFFSDASGRSLEKSIDLNGSDLEFLSRLAADCFWFASFKNLDDNGGLTEAELRFLYALGSGVELDTARRITDKFGSNQSLQSSIRRKLKVKTATEAVVLAAVRGWFDDIPFEQEHVEVLLRGLADITT